MSVPPEKRVLWIDAHLEYRSPTMLHLLHALPHLRAAGWEVEAWCVRSDASPEDVKHVFFPAPKWLGPFELLYFSVAVNLYGLWTQIIGSPRHPPLIHATSGTYLGADLVSVHFINAAWMAKQWQLGFDSWKDVARFFIGLPSLILERLSWWSSATRKVLAVSDSIREGVVYRAPHGRVVETFPNSYDETRFHPAVRAEYRKATRSQLGLSQEEIAFVFVSQGHYKRKGFWLAVAGLAQLRQEGRKNLRLLVVGGSPETLDGLKARLGSCAPDWADWVLLVGMQSHVEKYYAAADAFLFPSYFEAFSLAEIEAAACGLPLLLTPHPGSEMTFGAGVSGVLISFDPAEMSRQIAAFLDAGLPPFAQRGPRSESSAIRRGAAAIYEGMSPTSHLN